MKGVASRHGFSFEFDIPYRELAFNGTPNREMVTLQPSVRCLVNLTDMPFFVMDMSEVEHCHFERCTMASKNFDVVFVLKNLDTAPVRALVHRSSFTVHRSPSTVHRSSFTVHHPSSILCHHPTPNDRLPTTNRGW